MNSELTDIKEELVGRLIIQDKRKGTKGLGGIYQILENNYDDYIVREILKESVKSKKA